MPNYGRWLIGLMVWLSFKEGYGLYCRWSTWSFLRSIFRRDSFSGLLTL